jgi:glucan phosphoethanolaminetransferase (alkaline phosphatase superfamily)
MKSINKFLNKGFIPNILLLILLFFYAYLLFPYETWILKLNISLSTFIFSLCLFKINKWIFRVFIAFIALIAAFYYPIINFFGPVSLSNIQALMATNYAETSSYMSIIPASLYIKAFLLLLFPILLSFLNFRFLQTKSSVIILVLFFGLALSKRYYFSNKSYSKPLEGAFNIIPGKILDKISYFYSITLKGLTYQAQLLKKKDNWQIESKNIDKQLYIIIIGESVRYDVFSNPNLFKSHPLDTIPKINFEHAISYGNSTIPSLSNAFTLRNKSEPSGIYFPDNIVNLAKKAGLHTEWFSNQGSVGQYDNYISALAKCADYSQFLNNTNTEEFNKHTPDTALVSILKQRLLKVKNRNNMFFLHTIGSHPSACATTGGLYDKFELSDEMSCYIKTISNIKNLIYEVYEIAKKSQKPFTIVYFSDHGLTYDPQYKVLVHAYGKENFTIPLIILKDDLTKNINIKAYRNLGDFLNLFQEFTGIKANGVNYDYSYISEDQEKNWNQLFDGLNFNQLKDNPIPFE